jgi:DNA-binding transcriptional regulator YiaG
VAAGGLRRPPHPRPRHRRHDAAAGIKAAEELLEAAGWAVVGNWEARDTSFVATVEYTGGYRYTVEAREHLAPLADADGRAAFRVRIRPQSGDAVLATVSSSRAEMIAAALKVARESMGLSDGWLAAHLGKTSRTVRNWESGHVPADVAEEIVSLLRRTRETVEALVEQVRDDPAAEVVTYATDPVYRLAHPDSPFPASWHRAVVARVAAQAPHIRITYAG